jgi:histidinol-phosphate aminotransferase
MIDSHYKEFNTRDYMDEDFLKSCSSNGLLDCSLGTNPFINENLIEKYIEECTSEINKYPSLQYDLLKAELIKFYKDYLYATVDETNIAFGSGTMGILRNLCEFLIQEGTKVLGISPQFPRFISEVELKKGIYEYYSLNKNNNYKFTEEDFIKQINSSYSVISIENPNNPTGQIISIQSVENIVKKALQYNAYVIVDEAYGDYMPLNNSAIQLVEKYSNVIVLRSASKFFGLPNHRIGYLFADKEFVKTYNKVSLPFAFSDLSASIFIKALQNYNELEDTKQKTILAKQYVFNNLPKSSVIYSNIETPIFTIKTDRYKDLSKELINSGIISENCSNFINLNSTFARIRINNDYRKLTEILLKVL